jgi:hypothetical protein
MKKNTFFLLLIPMLLMLVFSACSEEQRIAKLQQRLDDGELPMDILQSRNVEAEDLQGLNFQGGVIIWLEESEGLTKIGSIEDLNPTGGAPWGCVGYLYGSRLSC